MDLETAFTEWAKGLRFGLYVEDETVSQVREVTRRAFEAGFRAGGLAALTHPDDQAEFSTKAG